MFNQYILYTLNEHHATVVRIEPLNVMSTFLYIII